MPELSAADDAIDQQRGEAPAADGANQRGTSWLGHVRFVSHGLRGGHHDRFDISVDISTVEGSNYRIWPESLVADRRPE